MPALPTDPDALVAQFCAAFGRADTDELLGYFAEDAVYHNIPLEPAVGKPAIKDTLSLMGTLMTDVTFEVHHQIASGPLVMNERTDHMKVGDRAVSLPVCGVFEVADGRITAWRDYFDMGQFGPLPG